MNLFVVFRVRDSDLYQQAITAVLICFEIVLSGKNPNSTKRCPEDL